MARAWRPKSLELEIKDLGLSLLAGLVGGSFEADTALGAYSTETEVDMYVNKSFEVAQKSA